MNNLPITSLKGQEMFSYLPGLYETSRVMRSIMQSQGVELDRLNQALNETLDQYFVNTATWGLDIWERELGIDTEPGKPLEQRRSVIISKVRGVGTVNVSMIKNVAESYDGGTVNVTLGPDEYTFTVHFVDTRGIPANLGDLLAAIEEIKPAHLAVLFQFTYLYWNEIDAANDTWNTWDAHGLTWDELELFKP